MKCKICGFEYKGMFCPKCEERNEIERTDVMSDDTYSEDSDSEDYNKDGVFEDIFKEDGYGIESNYGLCVEDIFTIKGRGIVVTGKVRGVTFHVNQTVYWQVNGMKKNAVITGIECMRHLIKEAHDGDSVGIMLRGIISDEIQQGCILYTMEE